MDLTAVIVALIGALATIIGAYIAIVPQVKKAQIKADDIEKAIENSESIKNISDNLGSVKAGLVSEMRKSLLTEYWNYANRGFDMTQREIEDWNDDVAKYKKLGGNGVITEVNNSLQLALLEREHTQNGQRAIKL